MAVTYDPAKNERNIRERGLSFERVAEFDFATAVFNTELRRGETRRVAAGYLDKRLHLISSATSRTRMECASSAFVKPTPGRQNDMAGRQRLTDSEGEVRELTAQDAAEAVPFSALPQAEQTMLRSIRRRGAQEAPRKVPISIRLSPDVADGLRATGEGWQRRADDVLRSWLATAAR